MSGLYCNGLGKSVSIIIRNKNFFLHCLYFEYPAIDQDKFGIKLKLGYPILYVRSMNLIVQAEPKIEAQYHTHV